MRFVVTLFCVLFAHNAAHAENATFTYLKTVPAAELTRMLNEERATFISAQKPGTGYVLPPVSTASNDVELYTVRYDSRVPEQNGRPIKASGLLALPVLADRSRLPLIAYQHGTVFGKYEVPSYAFQATNPSDYPHYDGSYEARYMAGLFAGNGYALMAADDFGLGGAAANPEAFVVKESTQRGSEDLYRDVVAFMKSKGIAQKELFLGGWSQGGLNTTGLQERLEADGIPVTAAFTASAPSDPYATLRGLIFYPRKDVDAPWLNAILALTVFSFENYYGPGDLAKQTLDPAVYDDMKAIYDRSYKGQDGLQAILQRLSTRSLKEYLRPPLRDPISFSASTYGKLLAASETYRQGFKAPLRMFYGTNDEVIKTMNAQLPAIYQAILIGNLSDQTANAVTTEEVEGATHRLTFITAAPAAKAWMDGLQE